MVALASLCNTAVCRVTILQALNLLFDALMIRFEDTILVIVIIFRCLRRRSDILSCLNVHETLG